MLLQDRLNALELSAADRLTQAGMASLTPSAPATDRLPVETLKTVLRDLHATRTSGQPFWHVWRRV